MLLVTLLRLQVMWPYCSTENLAKLNSTTGVIQQVFIECLIYVCRYSVWMLLWDISLDRGNSLIFFKYIFLYLCSKYTLNRNTFSDHLIWIYWYSYEFILLKTERKGLKFEGNEKTRNSHSFESGNGYNFCERVFGNVYKIKKYTSFWLSDTVILLLEMCPIAIVTYLEKNTHMYKDTHHSTLYNKRLGASQVSINKGLVM